MRSYGSNCRHDVNDRYEGSPHDSPNINRNAEFAEVERTTLEFAVSQFANDGNAVGPIESNGRKVEDSGNGGIGSKTNQIDKNTANAEEPDCDDGGVGALIDLVPDSRTRQHFVARVGPDGTGSGLNGCHGCEVENEAGGYCEEDASVATNDIVEDLCYGLNDYIAEGMRWVSGAVS